QWAVGSWSEGERATSRNIELPRAATDLARFVTALQSCDAAGGPRAGKATWYRGLPLRGWEARIRDAVARLDGVYDVSAALVAWEEALAAPDWDRAPVWFHGDLEWNLIARDGVLAGVI